MSPSRWMYEKAAFLGGFLHFGTNKGGKARRVRAGCGFAAVGLNCGLRGGNDGQKAKAKTGWLGLLKQLNRWGNLFVVEVGLFQVFVAFLDCGDGLWLEFFKEGQETPWIERLYAIIGILAGGVPWATDHDDGDFRLQLFECCNQLFGRHVLHTRVHHDSVQGGIFPQSFDGFLAAIGGDDIEFRGFYDEFPRGDAA